MEEQKMTQENGTRARSTSERRGRIIKFLFLFTITCSLPLTALLLWGLAYIQMWPRDIDIMGLLAISVGILGILIFYIFLYKYQMNLVEDTRRRWIMLALHGAITLVLFLLTIWLGYDSPWGHELIWGSYDMLSAAKPWIISVLVIGSITLLSILFEMIRSRFEAKWEEREER
ncbi:MAG: hypothetical protein IH600_18560 [Bacteroidetes bacterium]|nr:hypothetical protein [Bacteroidota bacterium]